MSDIAKTVGKRLRSYRQAQSLSQERLAEMAGLHPTYIGQVERGEKNLTIESLEKITSALQVPMSSVFELVEDRHDNTNYPLMAYDFFSGRKQAQGQKLYEILTRIDDYANS